MKSVIIFLKKIFDEWTAEKMQKLSEHERTSYKRKFLKEYVTENQSSINLNINFSHIITHSANIHER